MRCRYYEICEHRDFMSDLCMGFGVRQTCEHWKEFDEKRHGKRVEIFR